MITFNYRSNNSGGHWWLEDSDWKALEEAGWVVEWKNERWLGALATSASKEFETPDDGLEEWQKIIDRDPWAQGCTCCGPPHSFSYTDANGDEHYAQSRSQGLVFTGWG